MKKQNVINLVKYHVEKNEEAFISEVAEIAKEFDQSGDSVMANYLMELVSSANYYVPQSSYKNLHYLTKVDYINVWDKCQCFWDKCNILSMFRN